MFLLKQRKNKEKHHKSSLQSHPVPKLALQQKNQTNQRIHGEENNQFFQTCENRWEDSFYSSIPLHRIFISEKQKDRWFELMKDQKYAQFTGEFLTLEDCKKRGMNAPFGAGLTKRAYQLNVSAFLNASKQYLMNNDSWESNKFDLDAEALIRFFSIASLFGLIANSIPSS